jgi:hypothetical protein
MSGRTPVRALVVCALAWPLTAAAQGKDPVAGETLFREAREAAKRGDFPAACPKFAESQRLDPAAGTLFNLADCEERIGKLASAWQHYQQVAEELPATDGRSTVAKEKVAALAKRLPKLTIRLAPGAPPGTKVTRDDVELGAASLGIALPVDPGKHTVTARSPSGKEQKTDVSLAEGQAESLTLTVEEKAEAKAPAPVAPVASDAKPSAPPPTTPLSESSSPTAGYVVGGIGAASLVVSLITGAMVLGKKSTVESGCDGQKFCSDEAVDAGKSGKSLSTISTITFAVGVVGIGAGAYLILTHKPNGTSTALTTSVDPNGGSLRFLSRF